MSCNLKEFKEFIDNEMLFILGQMDKPSLIFDHLYLVSINAWESSLGSPPPSQAPLPDSAVILPGLRMERLKPGGASGHRVSLPQLR